MPAPRHQHSAAGEPGAVLGQRVGDAVEDPVRGFGFAERGQAARAQRVGGREHARGVDDRAGQDLVRPTPGLHAEHERGPLAGGRLRAVEAAPRHRGHPGAQQDVRPDRGEARQGREVAPHQLGPVGCASAGGGVHPEASSSLVEAVSTS